MADYYIGVDPTSSPPAGTWDSGNSNSWVRTKNYHPGGTAGFPVPGSGTMTLVELSAYVKSAAGGNIRLCLYEPGDPNPASLLVQGDAEHAVVSTTGAWEGHTTFSGTTSFVAGTEVSIGLTWDSNNPSTMRQTGKTSGDFVRGGYDYTGGWPSIPNGPNNIDYWYDIRAGFNSAAGAISIPVAMSDYRFMRG